MEQNQSNKGKIHYLHSYDECTKNNRIYLMRYEYKYIKYGVPDETHDVDYFIYKNALTEKQIKEREQRLEQLQKELKEKE